MGILKEKFKSSAALLATIPFVCFGQIATALLLNNSS
jgi:hypothetical protein